MTDWGLSPTRAYVTGISTFLLSQPSQYRPKTTSKTAIYSVSSFLPKSAFFPSLPALKHHTFTNFVPITLINHSLTASYSRFCEGCESKKCKNAGCARARTRESPIFTPHFVVILTLDSFPAFPLIWEQKNHSFQPQNSPKSSSILFDYPKSSLSSSRNFVHFEQKRLSHQARYFLLKTQKTSEIIQKISNVFPKTSDFFWESPTILRVNRKEKATNIRHYKWQLEHTPIIYINLTIGTSNNQPNFSLQKSPPFC